MEKIKTLWNRFLSLLKEDKQFRIKTIIITAVAVVVIAAIIIAICLGGGEEPPVVTDPSGESTQPSQTDLPTQMLDYSVAVTDSRGNALSGVIVNFVQDGTVCAMQQTGDDGIATKNLQAGEYTIELAFTGDDLNVTYDAVTLTPTAASATIVLYNALGEETKELNAYCAAEDAHKDYTAYYITVGDTKVTLNPDDRNYFIFAPTTDGIYEFSVDNASVTVGYYGSVFFVQQNNLLEPTESGSIAYDVAPGEINTDGFGSATLVIGLDGNGVSDCVLSVQRIGDHVPTIDEYPWDIYKTTVTLSPYKLPENVQLVDFDVTAKTEDYTLVLNEKDGFYHMDTADGPLVYVKLGVDSKYLSSFQTILDNSGINRYFFDDNDQFVKKENYSECLLEYISNMDEKNGVYPLTEDLVYIIQQRGEYVGWWNKDSATFIFNDDNGNPIVGLNTDIAWLFACCYAEEVPEETQPTEPAPTEPEETEPEQPEETKPPQTEPEETKPQETEPAPTEPEETEPEETKPVETKPVETKPQETEPAPTEPDDSFKPGKESSAATVEIHYYQIADTMSTSVTVKAGEYANFAFYRMFDMVITIESEDAYILYGNKEDVYLPNEDGILSFTMQYGQNDVSTPCALKIGNSGKKDATFKITFSVIPGTQNNPVKLPLGDFTTKTEAGEAQGFYYTFTAEKAGTLTVAFKSINIDKECQISLYNLNTYVYLIGMNETVSIEVNAGDEVQIVIVVADEDYEYPAATIKANASFK